MTAISVIFYWRKLRAFLMKETLTIIAVIFIGGDFDRNSGHFLLEETLTGIAVIFRNSKKEPLAGISEIINWIHFRFINDVIDRNSGHFQKAQKRNYHLFNSFKIRSEMSNLGKSPLLFKRMIVIFLSGCRIIIA